MNGVRRVLYRLPAVIAAVEAGDTIWIAEGEKCVEALERAGAVGTTNPGGAGKWKDEFATYFAGANVMIRRLGRLGDSSYVLYLIHILVVTLAVEAALKLRGATNLEPAAAALLIAGATVILAHAIHLGVERPLLRLLSPKRAPVAPGCPVSRAARAD